MQEIHLTQGKVALVDDEDFELVSRYTWVAAKNKTRWYACAWNKHGGTQHVWMHRLIAEAGEGIEIDHYDGNGLNNQRSNLRVCTRAQNMQNARKYETYRERPTSSMFKGVSYHKSKEKWQANIRINGELKYLGTFTNELDAAHAYDDAAKEAFGEFARTNL